MSKYKDMQQSINYQDNEEEGKKIKLKEVQNEEMYNITFFNAKSTSFPPINKK